MATAEVRRSAPASADELAAELGAAGGSVRVIGAGTKLRWAPSAEPAPRRCLMSPS